MLAYLKLRFKLFTVLLAFWFLLMLNFRIETIIAGILICALVTVMSNDVLYDDQGYRYHSIKVRTVVVYIVFLFAEIYKASFAYVYNVLLHHYEPVVFTIKLDVDDPVLVGIISNSITLTPGTITIDTDTENFTITVMTLAKPGISHEDLERPIREKFERLLKRKGDLS